MALRQFGGDMLEIEPNTATWTALEEKIFIQLMVEEVHKGNRSSTTFSRKGWKHIEQEFTEKANKRYSNCQFRNKFNQLRTRYNNFSKLLREPGFSWDPVLNTAIATDAVWESCIKANKIAKRFRKKGCPMFTELGIIFSVRKFGCSDVFPLAQYRLESEDNLDLEDESTNATPSAFPSESFDGKDYQSQSTGRRRRRSSTPTSLIAGKRGLRTSVNDDTAPSGTSDRKWVEVNDMKSLTDQKFEVCTHSSAFSITKCVQCLESIEGVDTDTYIKAINMFKDVDWREMFMAMSDERRMDWLASL